MFARSAMVFASLLVAPVRGHAADKHPTLNVRVVEPRDASSDGALLGATAGEYDMLLALEARGLAGEEHLGKVIASLRAQMQEMTGAAEQLLEAKALAARAGHTPASFLGERPHVVVGSKLQASQQDFASGEVAKLLQRVDAGGRTATKALTRLVSLTGDAVVRTAMIDAGAVASAEKLLKRPDTSEINVRLAGSLLTLLTGMPVTAEIADVQSGSDGRVDVVLPRPSRVYAPDEIVLQAESGMRDGRI